MRETSCGETPRCFRSAHTNINTKNVRHDTVEKSSAVCKYPRTLLNTSLLGSSFLCFCCSVGFYYFFEYSICRHLFERLYLANTPRVFPDSRCTGRYTVRLRVEGLWRGHRWVRSAVALSNLYAHKITNSGEGIWMCKIDAPLRRTSRGHAIHSSTGVDSSVNASVKRVHSLCNLRR